MRQYLTLIASVSINALVVATNVFAQTAAAPAAPKTSATPTDPSSLAEVIVTARKSKEKLQDVPLAITAVNQTALDAGHFEGLEDIANQIPGLKFSSYLDSFNGNVTIRGLQQENVDNAVGNVGTFLDGIYLQRGYMVDTSIGDYSRIEVVKGPQSALYGQNTFAGAVNLVITPPTDTYHFDGTVTGGNAGLNEEKFGVGGPIVKGLLDFRLFYADSDYNGTWRNNFPDATGGSKYFGGHVWQNYSGALKFTPTNRLTITASYYDLKRKQQIDPYYTIDGDSNLDALKCGTKTAGHGGYSLWCGNLPSNIADIRSGVGNPPAGLIGQPQPPTTSYTRVAKASLNYKISDGLTLTYTFGNVFGSALEQASFSTDAYNPDPNFGVLAVQREGGALAYDSHEIRLVYDGSFPIKGEVGFFHSDSSDHYAFGLTFVPEAIPYASETSDPVSIAGVAVPFDNFVTHYGINSPFGRLSYSFLDNRATLSAELRVTTTDLTDTDRLALASNPNLPLLKASYTDFTPRFTANYKLTPDQLLYASAARGAKAGGFNGYVAGSYTLEASQQAFGEETNWTYELGWKASLLQRRLVVDADLFYIDWDNKQEAVVPAGYVQVTSQSAGVAPEIYENVGNAYSYGFELTSQWRVTDHVTANGSLSLQNPRYAEGSVNTTFTGNCDNVVCNANGGVAGNRIPGVSQVSADFGADYHDAILPGLKYDIAFDESYRGPQAADDSGTATFASVWLTNAHLDFDHETWRLSLWAKNLFNERYASAAFSVPSIYQYNVNLGELRTYGVTLSDHF